MQVWRHSSLSLPLRGPKLRGQKLREANQTRLVSTPACRRSSAVLPVNVQLHAGPFHVHSSVQPPLHWPKKGVDHHTIRIAPGLTLMATDVPSAPVIVDRPTTKPVLFLLDQIRNVFIIDIRTVAKIVLILEIVGLAPRVRLVLFIP